MTYGEHSAGCLTSAAELACEHLEDALTTLFGLIGDESQTGAVRVSASKLIIDTALKLDARALAVGRTEEQLARLDAMFGIERDEDGICVNIDDPKFGLFSRDDEDV